MKKKIYFLAGLFILILSLFTVLYYHRISTRNAVHLLVQEKKMINILIAGSNRFNKNRHRFFGILSINPVNNNIGMTFIPHSYRIPVDEKKGVYTSIGKIDFSDFELLQNTFKKDLKMNIPFYIELYSPDVARFIDLIEGIDLYVLDQVKDIPGLKRGINYFDGEKTVRYINSAFENSLFIKYDRIQDILLTLSYNRESKRMLNNTGFISELFKSIKTNLLPQEILKIGEIVFKGGDFFTILLPGTIKQGLYIPDDISFKIYEEKFVTPVVVGKNLDAKHKIKILNGTGISGLARKMRNRLIREGLNVVEFGTSPYGRMKKSVIIFKRGWFAGINKIIKHTKITRVYPVSDNTQLHNVLIIIGEDLSL